MPAEMPHAKRTRARGLGVSAVRCSALEAARLAVAPAGPATASAAETPHRPNSVVDRGDDAIGRADMGWFGGEIKKPKLDALARDGLRGG